MFQQPSAGGDQFKPAEHLGSLVLIWVKAFREGVMTTFGESDAIEADVHVLDGPKGGEKSENALLFQRALIGSLKSAIGGEPVLGRIGQGIAKPGQNAPFVLQPYTDADAKLATDYMTRLATRFQPPAAAKPASAATTVDISTLPQEVQELLRQQAG